jgi:hypothetical protein
MAPALYGDGATRRFQEIRMNRWNIRAMVRGSVAVGLIVAGSLSGLPCRAADAKGAEWRLEMDKEAHLLLHYGKLEVATITPGAFNPTWTPVRTRLTPSEPDTVTCTMPVPGSGSLEGSLRCVAAPGGGLRIEAKFKAMATVELKSLFVVLDLPLSRLAKHTATLGEQHLVVPEAFDGKTRFWGGLTPRAEFELGGDVPPLVLSAAAPMNILCQDNRAFKGNTLSVRVQADLGAGGRIAGGTTKTVAFVLQPSQNVRVELPSLFSITAGKNWIPLKPALDIVAGSALDWSTQVPRHAPAGSQGWLTVSRAGHFAFEKSPAAAVRFYGVNFCFDAQYPTHEEADRLADRLMRLGYNAVRIHHYEREMLAAGTEAGLAFRPEQIDKLDYLLAALRQRGIYWTTDLYVSRGIRAAELWPGEPGMVDGDSFKQLTHVDDRAFDSWCAFAKLFLTHTNPYTKLRYVDDPALVSIAIVNENNLGNRPAVGRALAALQREWNRYLAARYKTKAALATAWGGDPKGDPAAGTVPYLRDVISTRPEAADTARFFAELEERLYTRMAGYLHEKLGVRALLTSLNGWVCPRSYQQARAKFDYVDDHFYIDHPQLLAGVFAPPTRDENVPPTVVTAIGGVFQSFSRVPGKPFTVTEFNYSAPGNYRGAGGLMTGALAALQDWDGLWRFAYSHRRAAEFEPSPLSYFDLARDPLNQAADRAMLSLFLRGDAQPASHGLAVVLDSPETNGSASGRLDPGWRGAALITRVGVTAAALPKDLAAGGRWITVPAFGAKGAPKGAYDVGATVDIQAQAVAKGVAAAGTADFRKGVYTSETGQCRVDLPAGVCLVNTPRTAGGFRPAAGEIKAGPVAVEITDSPATVWVTSLDDKAIGESRHLLVTHLTDLQQEGSTFADDTMKVVLAFGTGRPLVRSGRAVLHVPMPEGTVHAWSLAVSGARVGECKATLDAGRLTLPLDVEGPDGARMLYEIEAGAGGAAR